MKTMWTPRLEARNGSLYRDLADALARDVEEGRLKAGARLPTHRALARALGINVGTVTRAYAEAARRGLVDGEVGRGTFVRARGDRGFEPRSLAPLAPSVVDLHFNQSAHGLSDEELEDALGRLASERGLGRLLNGYHPGGLPAHREAGARLLRRFGVDARAEETLVTAGSQHAMTVALGTLCKPGDTVLVESLTYPGIKSVAAVLDLRLVGVPMDAHGIAPEALDAACAREHPRALYCMPTLQNPTGVLAPLERRREIAAIARRHEIAVVEDDTYGFLSEARVPPIAALAPELGYFLSSVSKSLAAGLRIGYLCAPREPALPQASVEGLLATLSATIWMASSINAELATGWIVDGTAERVFASKQEEVAARRAIARSELGHLDTPSSPDSPHLWLHLPVPWRGIDLVTQARARGVALASSEPFVVGRGEAPHAVRVCVATPESRADAERGLHVLAEILQGSPECRPTLV